MCEACIQHQHCLGRTNVGTVNQAASCDARTSLLQSWFEVHIAYWNINLRLNWVTSDPVPYPCAWEGTRGWLKFFGPLSPAREMEMEFQVPGFSHWGHIRSEPADRRDSKKWKWKEWRYHILNNRLLSRNSPSVLDLYGTSVGLHWLQVGGAPREHAVCQKASIHCLRDL